MPKAANDRVNKIVETAILNALNIAIRSIEPQSKRPPARRTASLLAGISGGVSGFFGIAALPIELPVTTTLMLRAIADIARHHGEDLSTLEARLACVEVFALGAPQADRQMDLGYYASRTLISRLAANATSILLERGTANVSAPVVSSLVGEIVTRFGVVVTERSAVSALPVLGARRRRDGEHDLHELFSARRERPFRHPKTGAPARTKRGAPALSELWFAAEDHEVKCWHAEAGAPREAPTALPRRRRAKRTRDARRCGACGSLRPFSLC